MPQKTKLIVLDINHTLIHDDTWARLNVAMGMTDDEDRVLWDLNSQGLLTNDEWVTVVNRIYRARKRATRTLFDQVVYSYVYIDGAEDMVAYLKDRGYTLALISGAMDLLVKRIAADLHIDHHRWCSEFVFLPDGSFDHFTYLDNDAPAKKQLFLELCSELSVDPSETICIGDGANESELFKIAKGITFAGSSLQDTAWRVVPDLHGIRDIL